MIARLRLSLLVPLLLALLIPTLAFAFDGGGDRPVRVRTEDGRSRIVLHDDDLWEALEELEDLDIDAIINDALSGLEDLDFDFDPGMRVYDDDGTWRYWSDMDPQWTRDFERQMERLGERISRQVERSVSSGSRWNIDDRYGDWDELEDERDELREELRELRREMRELERELESLRDRDDG